MSRRDRNKDEERWFAAKFQAACGDCPPGPITDSEAPDFLLAEGTIGIEVTRFFRKSEDLNESPEQEALRQQLLDEARRQSDARGCPPMHVSVHWHSHPLHPRNLRALASGLAATIVAGAPSPGSSRTWEWDDLPELLQNDVGAVRAYHSELVDAGHWGSPTAVWMGSDVPDIQRAIDRKEPKVPSYLRRVPDVWLLVVACTRGPSSFLHERRAATAEVYCTAFGRVYLLDLWDGSAIRLDGKQRHLRATGDAS